jgi:hypothetical protein
VVAIHDNFASTCDESGVIPDLAFVSVEELGDERLIRGKFGFSKGKYIGSYTLHLQKEVDHICTVVVKAYAVYVLEVDSHDLVSPYCLGGWALSGVNLSVVFALVSQT